MFVTPDASLKLWKRDLRAAVPELIRWARQFVRPGDVVWDIGANSGLFAFSAAGVAGKDGRVVAVEPDEVLARLVRKSARMRPTVSAPVDVLPCAVSDDVSVARFEIAERGRAANHLAGFSSRVSAGGAREHTHVITVTLDWLLGRMPAPALVKVDVEGAEASVLRGAANLLATARPIWLIEVGNAAREEVTDRLRCARYALYDASSKDPLRRGPTRQAPWNTLAVPQESLSAGAR